MANLRDQLLKAGLIDKKARHLADQEDRKKAKAAKSDATLAAEAAQEEAARRQRLEAELEAKRQADREREAQRQEQVRAAERLHRAGSTIDRNEVTVRAGRRRFYFRAGGTSVGRFDLHGRQADDLEDGLICIVRDPTDATRTFKLMDDAGLAELRSIDPTAVVFHAPAWRPIDEPSADVPVPAELAETGQTPLEGAVSLPEEAVVKVRHPRESGDLVDSRCNEGPHQHEIPAFAGMTKWGGPNPLATASETGQTPQEGAMNLPEMGQAQDDAPCDAADTDSQDPTPNAPEADGAAGSL